MVKYTYKRGIFDPKSTKPFRLSRSKIDVFTECQRCAYLDLRLGVRRVSGPPFTLNSAVDNLLKNEFDTHRANGSTHPLMEQYGIDAIPFEHKDMDAWRHNFTGIAHHHEPTNFTIFGAIDDVWVTPKGQLFIVDYKATAKKKGPSTTDDLYPSYKKQMEIYQWLFRQNGFDVSDTGYFVYVNGRKDEKAFDGKLEFDIVVIPYKGDDAWVEPTIMEMREVLSKNEVPPVGKAFDGEKPCDYCTYREEAGKALHGHMGLKTTKK